MKKALKLFGIIALIATIGFGITACDDNVGLPPPTGLTATANGSTLSVRWDPVNGANAYQLYASMDNFATQESARINGTSYTETVSTPGTYYFKVAAIGPNGEGAQSNIVTATVTGASLTISNIASIGVRYVYISPTEDTTWGSDLLGNGTISAGSSRTFQLGNSGTYDIKVEDSNGGLHYKWDYPISGNATLYFIGGGTGFNTTDSITLTLNAVPISTTEIQIYWNEIPGAVKYNVYNGTSSTGLDLRGYTTKNAVVNHSLNPNTKVYYKVDALNQSGAIIATGTANATTMSTNNYNLNGLWDSDEGGSQILIDGNSGTWFKYEPKDPIHKDALNKGYRGVGKPYLRNFSSKGNLTWDAQLLFLMFNLSSPNVAQSTEWKGVIITLSEDGQTMTINGEAYDGHFESTYSRITTEDWEE